MTESEHLDLAIIGGGVAGMYIADAVKQARPDWSIALFERRDKIGGRLRSVAIPGIDHKIELGGMRFLTTQRRVQSIVNDFNLPTHPFDRTDGTQRSYLRGRFGDGPADTTAGDAYDLLDNERGRSADDLIMKAFQQILPGAGRLTAGAYLQARASATYRDRRLIDWTVGEALSTLLSPEAVRFVTDAFGYDSGGRLFNVGDHIPFRLGGNDPNEEARTPNDGMDAIPRALAARFEGRGGIVHLGSELQAIEIDGGVQQLRFAGGTSVAAARTVITAPIPALRRLASASPVLRTPEFAHVLDSVEGFAAMKLYVWYERPWWRPEVSGIRMTTDLPLSKVFYVDTAPDAPATLLAMYTDHRNVDPWLELAGSASDGMAAPEAMLVEVSRELRTLHPEAREVPAPTGSALMHWGADPLEIGWTFWRPGYVSDEIMAVARQPDPAVAIHLAGETFSHAQSWIEGALESADPVIEKLSAV